MASALQRRAASTQGQAKQHILQVVPETHALPSRLYTSFMDFREPWARSLWEGTGRGKMKARAGGALLWLTPEGQTSLPPRTYYPCNPQHLSTAFGRILHFKTHFLSHDHM